MSVNADAALNTRVPVEVMARADRLQAELSTEPAYAGLRLTRAAVLRLALLAGLAVLEGRRVAGGTAP